ncbi:MAG: divalent-cation tolerance protein CutA [Thermoplasmata archaeon]
MHSMVYVTTKDEEEARRIVRHLVSQGLVACGNIFPIQSIYSWRGEVQEEEEIAIIMKTRTSLVERVIEEVGKAHSYEVPCAVSYPMGRGLASYLAWIDESTSRG